MEKGRERGEDKREGVGEERRKRRGEEKGTEERRRGKGRRGEKRPGVCGAYLKGKASTCSRSMHAVPTCNT